MVKIHTIAVFVAAASLSVGLTVANAQFGPPGPPVDEAALRAKHPELYVLPPVPHNYQPKKTAWGDPDLRGMWPVDSFGAQLLQRPASMGDRVFLSDEEYKAVEARMETQRGAASKETKAGKLGMGNWVEMTGSSRRTSMLIDPPTAACRS